MIYGDVCVNTHVYMVYAVYGMYTCARGQLCVCVPCSAIYLLVCIIYTFIMYLYVCRLGPTLSVLLRQLMNQWK